MTPQKETSREPQELEGIRKALETSELGLKVAKQMLGDTARERDEAIERAESAEKDLIIKNCSNCHGSGEFIDSESGGFIAKCHCWANRVREKDLEIEKLKKQLGAQPSPKGSININCPIHGTHSPANTNKCICNVTPSL